LTFDIGPESSPLHRNPIKKEQASNSQNTETYFYAQLKINMLLSLLLRKEAAMSAQLEGIFAIYSLQRISLAQKRYSFEI
jgi:hypothetical protein